MQTCKLLLVEDDPLLGEALYEALSSKGLQTVWTRTGAEALGAINDSSFDMLLQDVRLPDVDGLDLLQDIMERQPHCQALVMTGQATVDMAVRAMKLGAFDFIAKPFPMDVLFLKLERLLDFRGMQRRLEDLSETEGALPLIISRAPSMRIVLDTISIAAASDISILLQGETGTGKKLLAKTIHGMSLHRDKPFVRVNCAAIPSHLQETELFGCEKGALPGIDRSKPGFLEAAQGGTLYLDEPADLSLPIQATLLKCLEEQAVTRVGGTTSRTVDFRLICATRHDLKALAHAERFRKDLFYRINVITLPTPPLRERREDIPLLIAHFIERFASERLRQIRLAPGTIDALMMRPWPGNVKELANLIEQLSALFPGQRIREHQLPPLTDLPLHVGTQFEKIQVGVPLRDAVADFERRYILRVLDSLGGQKGKAADLLGISRKVLWEKLKRSESAGHDDDQK